MCLDNFDMGLRLPFYGFYWWMLHTLNVAPFQLNANIYRVLTAWVVLNSMLSIGEPTLDELRHVF